MDSLWIPCAGGVIPLATVSRGDLIPMGPILSYSRRTMDMRGVHGGRQPYTDWRNFTGSRFYNIVDMKDMERALTPTGSYTDKERTKGMQVVTIRDGQIVHE